jgi:hypothetical protein
MAIHLHMGMLMSEFLSSGAIMIQMEYACANFAENMVVIFKLFESCNNMEVHFFFNNIFIFQCF